MKTYTIFFQLKPEADEGWLIMLASQFGAQLQRDGVIIDYRLDRSDDQQYPLQMAVYFCDQRHLEEGFDVVKNLHLKSHPHGELMNSVSAFKVSFSDTEYS